MKRRAFTTIELLVVVGIIVVLIAILIPTVNHAREVSRRAACAANLRALGIAVRSYGETQETYPRTKYVVMLSPAMLKPGGNRFGQGMVTTAFTGARGANPFYMVPGNPNSNTGTEYPQGTGVSVSNLTPAYNDVTAALFLLIRTDYMNAKQFVCPSAEGARPDTFDVRTARTSSNFTSARNLSYSYTMPYPGESWIGNYNDGNGNNTTVPPATNAGYVYGKRMKPQWPLAADLNPGNTGTPALTSLTLNSSSADLKQGNSLNHARAGQNVAYVGGNVDWVKTPFAGNQQDNIYTRAKSIPDNPALTPAPDRASDTTDHKGNPDVNVAFGKHPPTNANDTILLPTEGADSLLPYKLTW